MSHIDLGSVSLRDLEVAHHEVLDRMRTIGPVAWLPLLAAWVVTDRELAVQVLRDSERFTVDDPRFGTAQVVGPSMLSLDGEEHQRHRGPFVVAYRPAEVNRRFGPMISQTAQELVGRFDPERGTDLVSALAAPLATTVAGCALGLDATEPQDLLSWYRLIVAATERATLGRSPGAAAEVARRQLAEVVEAAATEPGSVLHQIGQQLAVEELVANAAVFLFGAIETTEAMIANLFLHLLTSRGALDEVRDDRAAIDAAIEESLRLEPAAARVDRYATADLSLAGVSIRAGDLVIVSLAAVNRDPAVYDRPHEFDLHRTPAVGHLAFVTGPHACLGAQLARLQARAALNAVLDECPGLRLSGDPPPVGGVVFRKVRSLPVRWTLPVG